MKKTKILLFATLIGIFVSLFIINTAQALPCRSGDLCYKPNVPIPITQNGYNFRIAQRVDPDFLANYIVAIYRYGAGFAGIVAMFILVIAGWRWLFAAGNAQKISAAKDMVNGVLIGLALLFGGQLLLRQINEDFNSIKTLDIAKSNVGETISEAERQFCSGFDESTGVADINLAPKTCSDYNTTEMCLSDQCQIVGTEVEGKLVRTCAWQGNPTAVTDQGPAQIGNCTQCPEESFCGTGCNWYKNPLVAATDPCDCDNDRKFPDDECK